ncbi:MAG: DbpA RNA binding domain-containing protein [Bacteroidia bacterium]
MVRLICDSTGLPNARVGKIELRRSFSFFEVPQQFEHLVEERFSDVYVNDRQIRLEKTSEGGGGDNRGKRRDSKFNRHNHDDKGKRPFKKKEKDGFSGFNKGPSKGRDDVRRARKEYNR